MLRRFNYTGRKKINMEHIELSLKEDESKNTYFDLKLNLESYNFLPKAIVRVEAWKSNSVQRWYWGEVKNMRQLSQQERTLKDVPATCQFKILVIDPNNSGLLYGKSNAIRPLSARSMNSLLPVELSENLGQEIWKLDFGDEDQVVLLLNNSIPDIGQIISGDPTFRSLVMPEIFRSILKHAIFVDEASFSDYDDEKWSEWVALAKYYLGSNVVTTIPAMASEEKREEAHKWIDDVVQAFANNSKVKAAYSYTRALPK